MRKKSQDELGTLLTREIRVMLQDQSLTKEQRFDILAAIMFDAPLKTPILASFAKSLKTGYDYANNKTFAATNSHRKAAKEYEQRKREELKRLKAIERNGCQLPSIDINGNQLTSIDGINKQINKQGISPYKPPKGGGRKVPNAVKPEDLVEGRTGAETRHAKEGGVRTATLAEMTASLAASIESTEAFAHMRVNRRNLMRHLLPIVKKKCAAEDGDESGTSDEQRKAFGKLWTSIFAGLAAWTEKWAADGWQYAPGKITKWLADEKWLEEPRKKRLFGHRCGSFHAAS